MSAEVSLRIHALAAGCQAVVSDETRHYYGGYYHVRLRVVADVKLTAEWFESRDAYEDAFRCLGGTVRFQRMLEKMAVPEMEIESVRQSLISAFETNLLAYLERPDFPRRFAISEYAKARTSASPLRVWQSV